MQNDKLLRLLNCVGVTRTESVPLISHLVRDFGINWRAAKKMHELLARIPMADVYDNDGGLIVRPSVKVSKYSPRRDHRVAALAEEASSAPEATAAKPVAKPVALPSDDVPVTSPDGAYTSAKIQGRVISVNDKLTGYGRVVKIRTNQFGDFLFTFELDDGTTYEVSEFHLRK
jgi:hypothetical protein